MFFKKKKKKMVEVEEVLKKYLIDKETMDMFRKADALVKNIDLSISNLSMDMTSPTEPAAIKFSIENLVVMRANSLAEVASYWVDFKAIHSDTLPSYYTNLYVDYNEGYIKAVIRKQVKVK